MGSSGLESKSPGQDPVEDSATDYLYLTKNIFPGFLLSGAELYTSSLV